MADLAIDKFRQHPPPPDDVMVAIVCALLSGIIYAATWDDHVARWRQFCTAFTPVWPAFISFMWRHYLHAEVRVQVLTCERAFYTMHTNSTNKLESLHSILKGITLGSKRNRILFMIIMRLIGHPSDTDECSRCHVNLVDRNMAYSTATLHETPAWRNLMRRAEMAAALLLALLRGEGAHIVVSVRETQRVRVQWDDLANLGTAHAARHPAPPLDAPAAAAAGGRRAGQAWAAAFTAEGERAKARRYGETKFNVDLLAHTCDCPEATDYCVHLIAIQVYARHYLDWPAHWNDLTDLAQRTHAIVSAVESVVAGTRANAVRPRRDAGAGEGGDDAAPTAAAAATAAAATASTRRMAQHRDAVTTALRTAVADLEAHRGDPSVPNLLGPAAAALSLAHHELARRLTVPAGMAPGRPPRPAAADPPVPAGDAGYVPSPAEHVVDALLATPLVGPMLTLRRDPGGGQFPPYVGFNQVMKLLLAQAPLTSRGHGRSRYTVPSGEVGDRRRIPAAAAAALLPGATTTIPAAPAAAATPTPAGGTRPATAAIAAPPATAAPRPPTAAAAAADAGTHRTAPAAAAAAAATAAAAAVRLPLPEYDAARKCTRMVTLPNHGATCYVNTVLQMVAAEPPLGPLLERALAAPPATPPLCVIPPKAARRAHEQWVLFQLLLFVFLPRTSMAVYSVDAAHDLAAYVFRMSGANTYRRSTSEDATEFFERLVTALPFPAQQHMSFYIWNRPAGYTCRHGDKSSTTTFAATICLDVDLGGTHRLEDMLKAWTHDTLDRHCTHRECVEYHTQNGYAATRMLQAESRPATLWIAVCRNRGDMLRSWTRVTPPSILDIRPYCEGGSTLPNQYRLTAAAANAGDLHNSHYVALVRPRSCSCAGGQAPSWIVVNDSTAHHIDEGDVLTYWLEQATLYRYDAYGTDPFAAGRVTMAELTEVPPRLDTGTRH